MARMRYVEAVTAAMREEMAANDDVFIMGEDIRSSLLGTTGGLLEEFGPERVRDTPISEQAFTGLAIGAAMCGLRPIVEYCINTLQYVAMDQLINQLARLRYMSGGQFNVPVTIRIVGAGIGARGVSGLGAQHSDSAWAMLANSGLKVVVPASASDAKGLIKTAIRSDDPVIVYEPSLLYAQRGEVPDGEHLVPLGTATTVREGDDMTIVATGHFVRDAVASAEALAEEGLEIEVIDPRTIYPLDVPAILRSVEKTGRLVIADDGYRFCGFASEVAAIVADRAFGHLTAPIKRVTRPMVPAPYTAPLLKQVTPDGEWITDAVRSIVEAGASR